MKTYQRSQPGFPELGWAQLPGECCQQNWQGKVFSPSPLRSSHICQWWNGAGLLSPSSLAVDKGPLYTLQGLSLFFSVQIKSPFFEHRVPRSMKIFLFFLVLEVALCVCDSKFRKLHHGGFVQLFSHSGGECRRI